MLQAPTGFMRQWPTATLMPTSVLLQQSAHSDDLLALEEAHFEERDDKANAASYEVKTAAPSGIVLKLGEIRKMNSHLVVIGKPNLDSKEDPDGEAEEDDADNIDESDAEDFELETG